METLFEGIKDAPMSRVELHVHLDGAIRLETAWELLRRKQLPLPGDGSLPALRRACTVAEPRDLYTFLAPLHAYLLPAVRSDTDAIERISREFVEDRHRDHVVYCEARFSPHLLLHPPTPPDAAKDAEGAVTNGCTTTVDDVMDAVIRGIDQGEKSCPGTKVRLIVSCLRSEPQWSWEVLRICEQYKDRGVVGIDMDSSYTNGTEYSEGADVFQAAAAKGIRRTVHAGGAGPAASVMAAVDDLKAERIGHGYRLLEDEVLYDRCKEANVHFEVCPCSSYLTGAIRNLQLDSKRHPAVRFAEDGVSHSLSTDHPALTGSCLDTEYALLRTMGFTEASLVKANFQAALHSFLPPLEKQVLMLQLRDACGMVDYVPPSPASAKVAPQRPNITLNTWENRA